MRKFFTLLVLSVVAFIAYTYGAKAGRGRYREIQAGIDALWNDPRVKKARKQAVKRAEKAAKSL
ncbi:hypothetical protein GCM10022288_05140 [Gryllotalpicola kribbensis]|jgi:hypothetical protein|uniref:YtxH domain-containing protein n=1 Tax=Gryllotalpicola kribbensis TaxID=993084 RepID=A0ABP8AIK7_9MICO